MDKQYAIKELDLSTGAAHTFAAPLTLDTARDAIALLRAHRRDVIRNLRAVGIRRMPPHVHAIVPFTVS